MSLDVWLELPGGVGQGGTGIYVRENGQNREISRAEWDARFPGLEPVVAIKDANEESVYHANITHNLNKMAAEAGIYEVLWRPDESGIEYAEQLIVPLRLGLALLKSDPSRFEPFNPENGWGDYSGLVRFVENYLEACEKYPAAKVRVWR